jgi:hypothetical protein
MLKVIVDKRQPKWRFHCACKFVFWKKLRFINSVSLKLFHNDVTTYNAIYLDFFHYPIFLHSNHNVLEMFTSENGHPDGTALLGYLWSSCTKAPAKVGICT